ncbi:MAG: HAD-IB family hydrolase [Corynebacterium sp.]|nr:HAD-IB family hydrolase [Corynebacterium sp.]
MTQYNPQTPEEFLAALAASGGNLRRFLEDRLLRPLNDEAQREAGEAAVREALHELLDVNLEDFQSGLESVHGAFEAAGTKHITDAEGEVVDEGAAAFFDIDNTLVQGASVVVFAMGLYRHKFFTIREMIPVMWKQLRFRATGNENVEDAKYARDQGLAFVKGRTVEEVYALCDDIVESKMVEKIWPGTKALAESHIKAGQQVWLVSATPVQLGQILAKRLGFTGALGTVGEVKDGKFTGRLVGDILHGPGKKHAVAALAAIEGLDLSRCTAYSDSVNDVPMLSMVGRAVAINPDRKLRKYAERMGWQVHDFRSVRKAVRSFGMPTIITAAISLGGWGTWKMFNR